MSLGLLYLSFGSDYADCTIAALQSKIKNAPKTPACVLTNRKADLKSELCRRHGIQVKYIEAVTDQVRFYKTQAYKYTPWDNTLMLDADAWINKELFEQFSVLRCAPIALVHAHFHPSIGTAAHLSKPDHLRTLQTMHGSLWAPHYSSGLIFFRKDSPAVHQLFDAWHAEWKLVPQKDQGALMRAIVKTQVFPLVLYRDHWMTGKVGKGFTSHRFEATLPVMPRKGEHSPKRHSYLI
jgi:hypothetical protein